VVAFVFTRYRAATADCGAYRGPWPVTGPNWAALAAVSAKFPYQRLEIDYHTGLGSPGGDPGRFDWFDNPADIVTTAMIGTEWETDYSHSPPILGPQHGWNYPNYWWDYNDDPPFSLDGPPRLPGLRFFVNIYWGSTGIDDTAITDFLTGVDPLSMVPADYVAGGHGPPPWPNGTWSDWEPRKTQIFALHDFNAAAARIDYHQQYTGYFFNSSSTGTPAERWHAAATASQPPLQAAIAAGDTHGDTSADLSGQPPYGIITSTLQSDASVEVGLHGWQWAVALDRNAVPVPRLDLYYVVPSGFRDALIGPPPDYIDYSDDPYLWGWQDPYTVGGFGFQWETPHPAGYGGLRDNDSLDQLGFILRIGSSPFIGDQPPPSCPMRAYARQYTGPVTGWLPEDGDAVHLGVFTVDGGHGWWSSGYAFQWSGSGLQPFSAIPWDRFWIVVAPDYAYDGGTLPDIPAWSDPGSWNFYGGGYGGYTVAYDSCWSSYYYYTEQGFESFYLPASYTMPRWRFFKPTLDVTPPATRLSQRADGLGVQPASRLSVGSGSQQSAATRRVGNRNTFA